MTGPLALHRGDFVYVEGHKAMVVLASPKGESVFLMFDAIILGHVGAMPILWNAAIGSYVALVNGSPVVVTKEPPS